jgi:glutaredoxin
MEWHEQIWATCCFRRIFCDHGNIKFQPDSKGIIDQMSVKIYTTGWCLPCKNAKKLLSDKGVSYEELNIEELGITRNDLYDLTSGRTVPQIIINGNPIGGFKDLFTLHQSGDLDRLLNVSD